MEIWLSLDVILTKYSTSDYLHNSTETKCVWSQADEFWCLADLDQMANFTPGTKALAVPLDGVKEK